MTKLARWLITAAAALACQAASAVVVGFEYVAHILDVQVTGHPPPGTMPAGVGNAVVGTFRFDTNLAPDPASPAPDTAFYTYQVPAPLVAHRVRFQLPTVMTFLFDSVDMVVVNDHGAPAFDQDEWVVESTRWLPVTDPQVQTGFLLLNIDPSGSPGQPFNSIAPPATPPRIGDFNNMNEWSFTISSPLAVPFEQSWSIALTGRVVALDVAPLPEPPALGLLALGLLALGLGRRRVR